MKNGIEVRPNGVTIRRIDCAEGFGMYQVDDSPNGPWDYLSNARVDADHPRNDVAINRRFKNE